MPIRHHPFLFLFSRAQLIILSRVQKGPGADGGVVQKGSGADGRGGSWCRKVLGQEAAQMGVGALHKTKACHLLVWQLSEGGGGRAHALKAAQNPGRCNELRFGASLKCVWTPPQRIAQNTNSRTS